jgi:arsenate reductase (thioredoxin)
MKKRRVHVLFVCIGNVCRSAMALAMARKYGSDAIMAASAGTDPATGAYGKTAAMLQEMNIEFADHLPRRLRDVDLSRFDLIVNMSGSPLPEKVDIPVETWEIDDPYGRSDETFRRVRGEIEMRVMDLVLRVRLGKVRPLNKSAPAH